MINLMQGDCLDKLKELTDNSVDSIVTDPPYGLCFMGKKWDYDVPTKDIWIECLRVLRPGGHLLSFGGTRTYHRLVVAIEDAGFEIRDQIQWLYGSGFPKSHNLKGAHEGWGTALKPANEPICVARKPLEKGLTVAQNVLKYSTGALNIDGSRIGVENDKARGAQASGNQKTRNEYHNYCLSCVPENVSSVEQQDKKSEVCDVQQAMPFVDEVGTKQSALEKRGHSTGRLQSGSSGQQECIGTSTCDGESLGQETFTQGSGSSYQSQPIGQSNREPRTCIKCGQTFDGLSLQEMSENGQASSNQITGRWPANLILDEAAAEMLDEQSGTLKSGIPGKRKKEWSGYATGLKTLEQESGFGDSGGASRFFYVAKASKSERNAGLEGMQTKQVSHMITGSGKPSESVKERSAEGEPNRFTATHENFHPTVKPIKLMQYLINLVTPPNGVILDPFMGSGSTGVAAKNLNRSFIGIELDTNYFEIAKKRIEG